jgi:hypothetical protein
MKRSSLIFLLLIIQVRGLMATEFSVKEKSVIYTNAIKVLENYQTVINRMGVSVVSNIEKAKSDAESFLELFVNRQVLIFNDLDPAHKLSQFYEAETYARSFLLWYPDGITISLDLPNARVSDIIPHEDNVYTIDILAKKSINGNYMNQTLNKNVEELTFRIAFTAGNKSPGNFRIVGVRNASSNFIIDDSQALKEVNSEEFNPDDLTKIHGELKTVLKDYSNYLSLIGDPKETADDKEFYKTSFLKLFLNNDIRVFNDITPVPQTSLISLTDYLTTFISEYPAGIKNLSINADSAKFGKVMKSEDGTYYTYTLADKFFSGSYKGKDLFREMFPLKFKISFTATGKAFADFRISSIDISAANFYEASPGTPTAQKPVIIISPVTRKGLGVSFIGSFGRTSINNKNLEALTLEKNMHSWNYSSQNGYLGGIGIFYYMTDNIAVRSGLEFNKYAEKFSLSGKFTDNTLTPDDNGALFYKVVEASFDSLVTVNYITIPLLCNFTSKQPGKFGFYAEGGIKVSIPTSSSYSINGNFDYYGDYPSKPFGEQYVTIPEKGFYSRTDISQTEKTNMKGTNVSFYASAGINIPLGYFTSVMIGPEITVGLSDIMGNKNPYIDIFGKSYAHQATLIKNIGFRISLSYKL